MKNLYFILFSISFFFTGCNCVGVVELHCKINEKKCIENSVFQCKLDQSGYKKTNDCLRGESCIHGKCQTSRSICKSGEKKCKDNIILICRSDESGFVENKKCKENESCSLGACQPKMTICNASQKICQGNSIYICKDDGSSYEKIEDCSNKHKCEEGKCMELEQECVPRKQFCKNDFLYECSNDGKEYTKIEDCKYGCKDAICKMLCGSGELKCNGNDVLICSSDKSKFEKLFSCPENLRCLDGFCKGNFCSDKELRCIGNELMVCNEDQTSFINLYSCDVDNMEHLSGSGINGVKNGSAKSAQFSIPHYLLPGPNGSAYVIERSLANHFIRRIDSSGSVTTYVGSSIPGDRDGIALTSQFRELHNMASDSKGNLYVVDYGNKKIKQVSTQRIVKTYHYANNFSPNFIAIDNRDFIYVLGAESLIQISPDKKVTKLANILLRGVRDFVIGGNEDFYFTQTGIHKIFRLTKSGNVSVFAGTGIKGLKDGYKSSAQFSSPLGLYFGKNKFLYVSEIGNHTIREITPKGNVNTVIGLGIPGSQSGSKSIAKLNSPHDITIDDKGTLIISDSGNHLIRRVIFAGQCINGKCVPGKVCNDGERQCESNNVMICKLDGSGFEKLFSCPRGLFCQSGTCVKR